jgi:hypothetical protein
VSSVGSEPDAAEAPTTSVEPVGPAAPAPAAACPRCGTPLRPGQDWCLNCGAAATTRVASPSGWRTPVAIVATVLALALAGLVVAFLAVSDDSDELTRIAQGTTQAVPEATPAPTAPVPSATPVPTVAPDATVTPDPSATGDPSPSDEGTGGTVATWPAGRSAWTVILLSSPERPPADERAQELVDAGTEAGVLDSDDFSSLRGGYWVVFSGQYGSSASAESALAAIPGAEADGAYVREVIPR